jgi:hypothetical protein
MMQDLQLAGYAAKTRKAYLECIGRFAQYCWAPAEADQEQVRAWVARLQQSKRSARNGCASTSQP